MRCVKKRPMRQQRLTLRGVATCVPSALVPASSNEVCSIGIDAGVLFGSSNCNGLDVCIDVNTDEFDT